MRIGRWFIFFLIVFVPPMLINFFWDLRLAGWGLAVFVLRWFFNGRMISDGRIMEYELAIQKEESEK